MVKTGLLMACTLILCTGAIAQEYRNAENPYQDGFSYRVPNDLRPMVDVDLIRWSKMTIAPKQGKSIIAGKANSVTVSLELENLSEKKAKILFIVLLEDEQGRQIERYEMKTIKLSGGKTTTYTEKTKIDGEILQQTAKVWVFFEVTR